MSVTASALRELHRIHRQLADLRGRLDRGPKQVQAGESRVVGAERSLVDAKEAVKRTRMASDEKQLQLKQRENRIDDLKTKLNNCNSNREYQALKEQIAADQQANSVLSDEILEILDKLEQQQTMLAQLESEVVKSKQDLQKTRQRVDGERDGLQAELERVTAELSRVESSLPADFKRDYERMTKARGQDALAEVEGETCGGCYTMLTPQTMNELYLSKPVFCKSCGRLLYLPEDRGVGGKDR
jgi:predicted  nucleic acid-binding Zn-ribbon protein